MPEIFSMSVGLELAVKNMQQVQNAIEKSLKGVNLDFSQEIPKELKKASKAFSDDIMKAISSISGGLGNVISGFKGIVDRIMSINKTAGKGKGGAGAMGDASTMAGLAGATTLAAVGAGIAATVIILKKIHDQVSKGVARLEDANASFKGSRELMEQMWNLALRPIGTIMTMLMKPYLLMAMKFMQPRLKEMTQIISASGGNPNEEQMAQIEAIWKNTASGLGFIFSQMMAIVQPIAGETEGFKKALDMIYSNFTTGASSFIQGFLDGLDSNLGQMPKSLADWIRDNLLSNSSYLKEVPQNIKTAYFGYLTANPQEFKNLPTEVSAMYISWLTGTGAKNTIDNILDQFGGPYGTLANAFNTFAPKLGDTLNEIIKKVKNILSGNGDTNEPPPSNINVGLLPPTFTNDIIQQSVMTPRNSSSGVSTPIGNIANFNSLPKVYQDRIMAMDAFATGSNFVPETGLYQLHRGESVIPATRTENNKSIMLKPSFNINAQINSEVDMDAMVRRASRQIEFNLRSRGILS